MSDLISTITDVGLETVAEWLGRPLDSCYPLVFFDAIRGKIRDERFVRTKAVYIALGILPDGTKDILGIWIEQTKGAKFWLRVMSEVKNRSADDLTCSWSQTSSVSPVSQRLWWEHTTDQPTIDDSLSYKPTTKRLVRTFLGGALRKHQFLKTTFGRPQRWMRD